MSRFLVVTIVIGALLACVILSAGRRYSVTTQSQFVSVVIDHWTGRTWLLYGGKISPPIQSDLSKKLAQANMESIRNELLKDKEKEPAFTVEP